MTALYIILGIVLFALLVFLAATKAKRRGKRGEKKVSNILEEYLKDHKGYVINDVIIANLKGKTSQIDHILFTPYAIFVIETKNYSGRIYGSPNQQYWTQVLKSESIRPNSYRPIRTHVTKNQMFNPILQNRTHCSRIGGILNQKYGIISCIVFAQNNTEYIKNCENYVHNLNDLLSYLNRYTRVVFNDQQLLDMYNKINEYKIHPICTEQEHINRVRRDS